MELYSFLLISILSIVKVAVLPKSKHSFNTIPPKILAGFFFTKIDKLIPKKGSGIAKPILEKNKVGGLSLPKFKI